MMAQRPDLFTQIHKGVRAMLYDASVRLQTTDFTDSASSAAVLETLDQVLDLLKEHTVNEDAHYFPPLQVTDREVVHLMTDEHQEAHRKMGSVRAAMDGVRLHGGTEAALQPGARLNRTFNHFMAYYLRHMNHEEETALPAMWRACSDEQLLGMRSTLLGSTDLGRSAVWLRWMLPSLNDQELTGMLKGLAGGSPESFLALFGIAEKVLPPERWERARKTVGI